MSAAPTKPINNSSANSAMAARSQRLVATIIDGFVLLLVVGPVSVILGLMGLWTSSIMLSAILSTMLGGAAFVASNYLFLKQGQTIGKKVMNLRIVGRDDQLLSVDHLLLKRYLPIWAVGLIPYIGGLLGLANVLCIFRESQACFHDDIAETKVVQA